MWIVLFILGLLFGWAIAVYNQMVKKRFLVREAFSGIDVQLKRRHELIPRLVEVTKGYMRHEQKILEEVTAMRARSVSAQAVNEKGSIESSISQGIKSVFAVAENYPDLKADSTFLQLHQSLVEIEDQLQMARRYYNGAVRDLNTVIQSFPALFLAGPCGFMPEEFFEIEYVTERKSPEIKF